MIDEFKNEALISLEFKVLIVPIEADIVELLTLTGVKSVTVIFVNDALVALRLEQLMLLALTFVVVYVNCEAG